MPRVLFPPPAPTTFPIAATAVTDNFTRVNQDPIGAPWNIDIWAGSEAAISSNRFVSISTGVNFEGGATYPWTPLTNFEMLVTVETDLSGVSAPEVWVAATNHAVVDRVILTSVTATVYGTSTASIVTTGGPGRQIGLRVLGSTLEGWFRTNSTSTWQLIGPVSRNWEAMTPTGPNPPVSDGPFIYVFGAQQIALTEFRIASFGQLIPHAEARGSRATSW